MIALAVIAFISALVAYMLCSRFGMAGRLLISAAVFVVPIVSMAAWLIINGDRAPAGAITIYPADKAAGARER